MKTRRDFSFSKTKELADKYKHIIYHTTAIVTVCIWGTTFVSTKTLINAGLSPVEILLYRFILAYTCIWTIAHKRLFADTIKDEIMLSLGGLCGGSLYFIAENTALSITLASNVSLLICTTPIFTFLLCKICYKDQLSQKMIYGSLTALLGVGMVVFNGSVVLKIRPLGDMLTLVAALLWAIYSLILRQLSHKYSNLFITRKIFFYSIMSLIVYFMFFPLETKWQTLAQPTVYANLLFLGIVASMLCYIMWNAVIKVLGTNKASNYIYVTPLVTLLTSAIFLSEPMTVISTIGAALILFGVYTAAK